MAHGNTAANSRGGKKLPVEDQRRLRVAREKALAAGKTNAFVTYLSKSDEIAEMGGWA
jgi:hypothetical protein